ncbi:hypothetical protein AB6A40_002374 [Gnathostoma spinigerum]|uniref:ATP-dependent (S)-NAD(P)H-hydrate dehydratase n=1 Tax=Gnathostoma spinigerum TaxID=75299 RepID=A0ABD6E6E0_9BILA
MTYFSPIVIIIFAVSGIDMPMLPPSFSPSVLSTKSKGVLSRIGKLLPPLSNSLKKGELGRIGVVGGSPTYSGAPYFAAITALKVGSDMVHVFAPKEAAMVIKTYSPELMVHPSFDPETLRQSLHRIDAFVLGPGLGRDEGLMAVVEFVCQSAREKDVPLVVDADGLYFLSKNLAPIRGYSRAILTPNFGEFKYLYKAAFSVDEVDEEKMKSGTAARELAENLGCTIFQKGNPDFITNGSEVLVGDTPGSPRRCGGQGDLLSGTLAVFSLWAQRIKEQSPTLSAGLAASELIRTAANTAFEKHGRAMTASDMIDEIPGIIRNHEP